MLADTLIARAIEQNGLSFGDPATRRGYLLRCYPGDVTPEGEPSWAAENMGAKQSGCLLNFRGGLAADEIDGTILWRGKPLDVLRCSYAPAGVIGFVETMLLQFAKQRGVYVDNEPDLAAIELADLVVIGQGGSAPEDEGERARWLASWGGLAHGLLVTGLTTDEQGRTIVESIDGGQLDPITNRATAIRRCVRRVERRGAHHWLVSDNGKARRIGWRMRAGALPCR